MTKIKENFRQLFLIMLIFFSINCAQAQEKNAVIHFENKKYDFGQINLQKDSLLTTVFFFENKGNITLIIQKVTTSCGCTLPEWTKKPVEPGEKGLIKLVFNPKGFSGRFSKSIYVKSNAKEDVVILKIEGEFTAKENKSIFDLFKRKMVRDV
ncbi:MAG: DUF1573 domain-containing protein [Bacteroidales bacterium]|jgi:hypothetical protein|nr:DUF1573 domain-containing protein [Bacteroidales bacterium]